MITLYILFMLSASGTFLYTLAVLYNPSLPSAIATRWHVLTLSRDHLNNLLVAYHTYQPELPSRHDTIFNPSHLEHLRVASDFGAVMKKALHKGDNQLSILLLTIHEYAMLTQGEHHGRA